MIFGNIGRIVDDHYISLAEETGLDYPFDYGFLISTFVVIPSLAGYLLATYVTIWSGFIAASAPVLSVLTGFSINTIILLMRYNGEDEHPYEQNTVEKTKEFTLYSILIGVLIIATLVFGFILVQVEIEAGATLPLAVSGIIYALIAHYFLTLLVITHRLWSLIHGGAIDP
jgi:hydrogenase-4 membrane subunit HyfE